ncbi:hypothetical protein PHAVU_009G232900, partial [Phaseolus vulgaris]
SHQTLTEQHKEEESRNEPKLPFLSLFPWGESVADKFQRPSTINKGLRRKAQRRGNGVGEDGEAIPLQFRPYVCKVPWHTGVRAYLSQLFPRYGHYCGPNWSSGKDGGSLVWDRRPIDWLDFCCYCHDIGNKDEGSDSDSGEIPAASPAKVRRSSGEAKLLKADLAFLECLEKQHGRTKGDPHVAFLYKTMCINGLRNFLIPYRRNIVNLQHFGQPLIQFGWLSNLRWSWNFEKAYGLSSVGGSTMSDIMNFINFLKCAALNRHQVP